MDVAVPVLLFMRQSPILIVYCLIIISSSNLYSQTNLFRPQIVGQTPSPLTTSVNQPITIELTNLIVVDADLLPVYPNGFTLEVGSGRNYDVSDATVTPDEDFVGRLSVPVRVDDGRFKSRRFEVQIEVSGSTNATPVITGQEPLTINQGETLTIELTHLQVEDPDNEYPADFSLTVVDGDNYTVDGSTITPEANFTGSLTVPVTVNDGNSESDQFNLAIEVGATPNVAPQITGQETLTIAEDTPLTLKPTDLKVTDPDNSYPNDFTITINDGSNYSVSGLIITPDKNFNGDLSVQVFVNDGTANSPVYNLKVTVTAVNDGPVITGQESLETGKNTPLLISLSDLKVSDPDNNYPDGFRLNIQQGSNYTVTGNLINPAPEFTGTLTVNVTVNDGTVNSQPFPLQIVVATPANTPPEIIGQKVISIVQNSSLTIALSHLSVRDPDNTYPIGFSLRVLAGDNYTVQGTTIKPLPNFTDNTLFVKVVVNDGTSDSAPFDLKIQVIPASSTPIINGQKEISVEEDNTVEVSLGQLEVTDNDNPGYPKGFSLTVLPGDENIYTVSGAMVTPAPNLNGFIEVGVKVSDGINVSDEFKLSVLITPVNDAPKISDFDDTPISYEPGNEPADLFPTVDLSDVDNDHLSMVEVGFAPTNFSPENDELLFTADSTTIKAIYDPKGILFLVGYAPIEDYRKIVRTIQYNYRMTLDENGNPSEILSGSRLVYLNVHDGQLPSDTVKREINMETKVALDIPNTFTPNGDQENDTWQIYTRDRALVDKAVIRVFDKKGQLIFESIGLETGWDGISNGQVLPVDTYYYTIDLNLSYMKQTYKGVVTILH